MILQSQPHKQLLSISGQSQIHSLCSLSVSILCNYNLWDKVGRYPKLLSCGNWPYSGFWLFVLFDMTLNICMHLLMLLTNPVIYHHVQLSLLLSCSISFLPSFITNRWLSCRIEVPMGLQWLGSINVSVFLIIPWAVEWHKFKIWKMLKPFHIKLHFSYWEQNSHTLESLIFVCTTSLNL